MILIVFHSSFKIRNQRIYKEQIRGKHPIINAYSSSIRNPGSNFPCRLLLISDQELLRLLKVPILCPHAAFSLFWRTEEVCAHRDVRTKHDPPRQVSRNC